MSSALIRHQTTLSGNIVLLCRFLRNYGYNIGPTEETDVLFALEYLPIDKEIYFKEALRAILPKNQYQRTHFNDHYDEFWQQLSKDSDAKVKEKEEEKPQKKDNKKKAAQFESLKNWLNLTPSNDEKEIAAFSELEVLTKKDFSDLSEEEMLLMLRLLQKLARKLAHQKSRLKKASKKHHNVDLRRTIRTNMRNGGDIQKIVFSKPKERKLKLVLLCDVSRSMDLYSRFFIHLIYAFQHSYDKIKTFVFSTALHDVSELLDQHAMDKAYDIISDRVPQWSGGTTIGSCLHDFVTDYSHGMLDKKTIVMILSDGWDTGAPEQMKDAMKEIYKKSKKVIWLNPLAGNPNFAPESIGMQTAMPYIDVLASAHNLDSFKKVMQQLHKRRKLLYTQ